MKIELKKWLPDDRVSLTNLCNRIGNYEKCGCEGWACV